MPHRWSSRLLYLGVVLFGLLAAFTTRSIYSEWREQIGQTRADALFQLVQGKGPMRPTDTPGASAWLNLELRRHRGRIADPAKARLYGEVADWRDTSSVPPLFEPIRRVLATPPSREDPAPAETDTPRRLPPAALGGAGDPTPAAALRSQHYLELDGRWFVVTRRRALDETAASDRFLARAAPHLRDLGVHLEEALARRPLPALPGDRPPRVARLYALAEDGTLITLPLAAPGAGPEALRRAAAEEGRELRKLPELPTFVSNEFYFRFDFGAREPQSYYSGLYLDLGGQGLVATLTVPEREAAGGLRWLVGADLTFDVDWTAFARQIETPMVAAVVQLPGNQRSGPWQPWTQLHTSLGALDARQSSPALRRAVAALAGREPYEVPFQGQPYVVHGAVEGQGAVAAFQVAASRWLLVLFPRTEPRLPLLPVLLSAGLLALLLAGFERNRRRAEQAQARAEGALREKQNLLNTMQVPLIVVDPNTDEVVSSNRAAETLGIRPGSRIADLVAPDPRARAHYERMQVAGAEPRRAYGVPVRVRGEGGGEEERYAVVRSVAVTAPIEALAADERHRLGVLFLLEPEADLTLLTEDLVGETRGDERRKLAGLLTHGLDTLVRVLAHLLRQPGRSGPQDTAADAEMSAWLAGYVDARLRTVCWLLDHWDAAPPLPPDCSVEAAQARATLERLQSVFARVAADADLRCRLHWDNGVLCAPPEASAAAPFTVEMDWPDTYWFPCPVRGGFGYFLTEVLVNAVRHGRPGSVPAVRIAVDRARKEVVFEVENETRADGVSREGRSPKPPELREDAYGGTRILRRLTGLFDWEGPEMRVAGGRFQVSWRVPASERGDPRRAD
jgi:PAS domain-containing protein